MVIKTGTKIGNATQIVLGGNSDLLVRNGVTVQSLLSNAIDTNGGEHDLTIAGSVIAELVGLDLEDTGNRSSVLIRGTGEVTSTLDDAIHMGGRNVRIENQGLVQGDNAIVFYGTGNFRATVVNSGAIFADNTAIQLANDLSLRVTNTGTISVFVGNAIIGGIRQDVVINKGSILGSLSLGGGNDVYDGRLGRLTGSVDGDTGNDRFVPGVQKESFFGGSDVDVVDFRNGTGVNISLDGNFANTGTARNDVYSDIERVFGSLTGADRLGGTVLANELKGFGGRDRLQGESGNDTLVGGNGIDTLNGGAGFDTFVFDNRSETGDRIVDFNALDDQIAIDASAFGGGLGGDDLIMVTLPGGKFHAGGTNKAADAGDRFIFRTGDETLWFDRDGTGNAFNPVLVADLQDGATLSASDITLI